MKGSLPSFSVLLIATALSVVGLALVPSIKVQNNPEVPQSSISVDFSLDDASARTLETEVTSRLEGVLSNVSNVIDITSISEDGYGWINLSFAKGTDMQMARFEVSSQIRSVWPTLPDGTSYPSISLSSSGRKSITALTYVVKGSMPSKDIASYVERYILPKLSLLDGIEKVNISGDTPYHWVIEFDKTKASSLGISALDIRTAFNSSRFNEVIGIIQQDDSSLDVRLKSDLDSDGFANIPICRVGGRIIYLGDIATWRYEEAMPSGYFRLNGLNMVTLSLDVCPDANLIEVTDDIKMEMNELQKGFPSELSATIGYDSSDYIRSELKRIIFRTGLCLFLLLLFVLLVSRSWRYLFLIAVTLAINLLVSVAAYALVGLHVHYFTLAGITVSLGIIIDTSIVMIDHWWHFHNRSIFPALLGAVLTTVASLSVILFLPDTEKANLADFAAVIAINLTVSLLVAWFVVPALMDYVPLDKHLSKQKYSSLRRTVKWNRIYMKNISWGRQHRWVYITVFVIAFGIPTFLLPPSNTSPSDNEGTPSWWQKPFQTLADWKPYANNRRKVDKILGSSFALFDRSMSRSDFYRKPEETVLRIHAAMPEGCSVAQLNEVVRQMENYLSKFDGISRYVTSIVSYDNATIEVYFKPDVMDSTFPYDLKTNVTALAASYGGAIWNISGVDERHFNNDVTSKRFSGNILLNGYNYDELRRYADSLIFYLSKNKRVSDPQVWSNDFRTSPETELHLEYDFEHVSSIGANPYKFYSSLSDPLYQNRIGNILQDGSFVGVDLVSSDAEYLDMWHITNTSVVVDSLRLKLSDVGSIKKKLSGVPVRKHNQSYNISVRYDYIGSWEQAQSFENRTVIHMNKDILPMGFRAALPYRGWFQEQKYKYGGIILLIIAIIFVICAITFESIKKSFAIIFMIPISFIGVFLTFGLSRLTFDQGGFAAMVMLCGLVVNAAIYILFSMKQTGSYIKAFDLKIWPITLTILSTVLGLLPFLFDGPNDVFWFDFAIGTITGLVFSAIAILFFLPAFASE